MRKQREYAKIIFLLAFVGLVVGVTVQGASSADVAATVTVQNISVTVSDGIVAYGTLAAGGSKDTVTPSDLQTATNNGNITETINIRGTNSAAWTLAGTASGATNYKHEFSKDRFATAGTALTTSNQELASGVASGGSQTFDLKVTTPPSASVFTEQSVNVVVVATAS